IAEFIFSQRDMPADLIPYWDMRDPAIKTGVGPALDGGCPRDASAAAITASALYELSGYLTGDVAIRYRGYADKIVSSLETNYQPQPRTAQGFLLLHSTGNYPGKDEIDVPINYADYYYLEALLRRK
ncbi:MAG: glycosyl hydrolase family 88, partial [Prevotella sp.]|nr:glycosyl hydrolase family 88 [Prevotella sp.]